ncbi:MAG: serine/threonine protein kinase [Xenococcus sp. MO_188.B8]|nr:serine/threonine protein kinase [Xenococcus sp. MO_188.B8]
MSIKFTKLSSIVFLTTIASLFPLKLWAQTTTKNEVTESEVTPVSVQQVFTDAFFRHSGNAFRNDGYIDQLNNIFGFNRFPEIQISKDGELVDILYQDSLKQQAERGVPMKTRDLGNPYDTSLRENPGYIGY